MGKKKSAGKDNGLDSDQLEGKGSGSSLEVEDEDGEQVLSKPIELDLINDVPPPECKCAGRVLRRERYRPHLCPMEIRNKYSVYEGLEGIQPGQLIENQLFRRVESHLPPDNQFRDQLISVEPKEKTRKWCEHQLAEYDALLLHHNQIRAKEQQKALLAVQTSTMSLDQEGTRSLPSEARNVKTNTTEPHCDKDAEDRESEFLIEDPCKGENLALPYTRRAALLLALGRYNEALDSAEKATTLNVHLASAFYQKGLAHYYLGDYAAAMDVMLQGLRYNPHNPRLDRAAARLRVLL